MGIPALFHLGSYPEAPGPSAFSVDRGKRRYAVGGTAPPPHCSLVCVVFVKTEGNAATPWEGLPPHRFVPIIFDAALICFAREAVTPASNATVCVMCAV